MSEKFANQRIATTLVGGIDDTDTTLVVASAAGLPDDGVFRIIVGTGATAEIVQVGAISGSTLTSLTRGSEGTTPRNWPNHTAVSHIITAASLEAGISDSATAHVDAADPHPAYQKESEKGQVSGYASLDSSGKVPTTQIPSLAISNTFVVASEAAMLALAAQAGDIAVRTDLNQSFILTADPASTLGNWQQLLAPADAVQSVNGQTGTVLLDASGIAFVPTGSVGSIDVQAAIAEVATESVHPNLAAHDSLGLATDTELTTHAADTTSVHGVTDTSVLETTTGSQAKVDTHTAATDPHADRAYADSIAQGLDVKEAAVAATTVNITLSGPKTLDGYGVIAGDRVLVKNQTSAAQNGIYDVSNSTWTRSTDADADAEVNPGMFCFVTQGTTQSATGWILTTQEPITVGTTALSFSQFSGSGQITAGGGLTKTGTTLDVVGDSSITVSADQIAVATSHTGSTHAAIQAAAEATASADATSKVSTHAAAADPHTGYQKESERAQASGYASLDSGTKVPLAQLPTGTTSSTVALGNVGPDHIADASAAHAASAVAFTPTGTLASTDVQAAIAELGTDLSSSATYSTLAGLSLATGHTIFSGTNSATTSSISPTTSVVFVYVVDNSATSAPSVLSITGVSGTFSEIADTTSAAGLQRLSLWIGTGCSGSGALTITLSGTATSGAYNVVEFSGIDTTSPYVASNVKTRAGSTTSTSASVTPDALVRSANVFLVGVSHGVAEGVTPANSATEINDDNGADASGIETNFKPNASGALGGSWATTTTQYKVVGVELQAAVTSAGGSMVPKSAVQAKGDLILGTASGVIERLPAGANGSRLVADSYSTRGASWRSDVVDPRDYGADPTGGRPADAAFAAMLSDIHPADGTGGATVLISGAYRFTRPIYSVNQGIRWVGTAVGTPTNYDATRKTSTLIWDGPPYVSISTLTYSSGTGLATCTTSSAHGFSTGDRVTIAEVTEAVAGFTSPYYNGTFQITKTGATTFTYTPNPTPLGNADAATGVAGFSLMIVEQSYRDHFEHIFFQGNRSSQPVDLLYFNKPVATATPGPNQHQGADHCLFGAFNYTSPQTVGQVPLYRNARYGIRFGGISGNGDMWNFTHNQAEYVGTAFKIDQTNSVWGVIDDLYVHYCDYGIDTTSRTKIDNLHCDHVSYTEVKASVAARLDINKWESENLGWDLHNALFLNMTPGSSAYGAYDAPAASVLGAHWRMIATFAGTNMVDVSLGGGRDYAITRGGLSMRNCHVEYNASAPTPAIKARGTTATAASFLTIEDCTGFTLSDLDVAAAASGGGLDVNVRMPTVKVRTHLASGASLDTSIIDTPASQLGAISAEAYGAVGDNATPNDTAFANALAALSSGAGPRTLLVGAGTFVFSSDLVLPNLNNVTIQGRGRTATTLSFATGKGIKTAQTAGILYDKIADLWVAQIGTAGTGVGIDFGGVNRSVIERVRVTSFATGVKVHDVSNTYDTHHNVLYDPIISDCTTALWITGGAAHSANDGEIYGGELSTNTTAVLIDSANVDAWQMFGTALESNTTALDITGVRNYFHPGRFEGNTTDVAFRAGAGYNRVICGSINAAKIVDSTNSTYAGSNEIDTLGFSSTPANELPRAFLETFDATSVPSTGDGDEGALVNETANRAYIVRIVPQRYQKVVSLEIVPITSLGNVDVAVVDANGASILATSGSTAMSGTGSTRQTLTLSSACYLLPGRQYYFVVAFDTLAASIYGRRLDLVNNAALIATTIEGLARTRTKTSMFPLSGKSFSGLSGSARVPWICAKAT